MNAAADAVAASLQQAPIRQQLLISKRLVGLAAIGQASLTLSRCLSSSRTRGTAVGLRKGLTQTWNEDCEVGQINMWLAMRFGQTGL